MNRRKTAIVFCALFAMPVSAGISEAGSLPDAKVSLHLKPHSTKADPCLPESQGGPAPDLTPCSQYDTSGLTGTSYDAYLTVVSPGPLDDHPGVGALSCGILYQGGPLGGAARYDGVGVDVYEWFLCTSGLEFRSGPTGLAEDEWPASGGGNRMTFDRITNCQLSRAPGYESEGVLAIFGVFYLYAYSPDVFEITPNNNTGPEPELDLLDCSISTINLPIQMTGSVAFTSDGSVAGINPCRCLTPARVDFGVVPIGETRDLEFAIRNEGADTMEGSVPPDCGVFQVIAGSGPFSLPPGDSLTVTVRYEAVTAGDLACDLLVGGPCPEILVTASTPPDCLVDPTIVEMSPVAVGDTTTASFTVANGFAVDLDVELSLDCPAFGVLEGAGPHVLLPGEQATFTVRFSPTETGEDSCVIDTGTLCAPVTVRGTAYPPDPLCVLSTSFIDFDSVAIGETETRTFAIMNEGAGALVLSIPPFHQDGFSVMGQYPLTIHAGQSVPIHVRFTPTSTGPHSATMPLPGGCSDITFTGYGLPAPLWTGLDQAVLALHAAPRTAKGECLNAPSIPCREYSVQFPVRQACDLWLVAARGGAPGFGALTCGITYQDGGLGGLTMRDGVGVDIYTWTFCTSGLEFPSGYSGLPEDEWPASGGGNRITWDGSTGCPTTVYGDDGIHAVAGSFYIYAYSDDVFAITPNYAVGLGPELMVVDCNNSGFDLSYPEATAQCAFGILDHGYNPCDNAVPVRLLSFTASRVDAGAELRWVVAGAENDHLGFEVYRGVSESDRVRVSDELLTGRESYVFVDADPPSAAVSYWLAERSRTGAVTWHGPAELAAATIGGPGLMLRHASPNPFLTATTIGFRTGVDGPVTLRVFDTAGREVARPFSGTLPAGDHQVVWDGRDASGLRASAGIYFYRVESDQGSAAGKVVLIR